MTRAVPQPRIRISSNALDQLPALNAPEDDVTTWSSNRLVTHIVATFHDRARAALPVPCERRRSWPLSTANATTANGAVLLKDETACIRCGLCARRCPAGVITMQVLYREAEAPLMRLADQIL